jgi:predicted dienelactone hydrolase
VGLIPVTLRYILLTILLVTTACSRAPALTDADIRAAYRPQAGPLGVVTIKRTALPFPELEKELQMRLAFPASGGPYPVIVLSHGNGCSQDLYAGIADHWASWGYVVIQPVHMDSRDLGFSMKGKTLETMNLVVSSRRADLRFILDSLDALQEHVPGLRGKPDADHLIAAGHSMGGGTAMVLTGVTMVNPRDQSVMDSDEDRFEALILITEPGNNRMMPSEPWRLARVPTFVATGSGDFSLVGARDGKKSKSGWQLPADADRPDQPRWYLFIDEADHYLGGLICKSTAPGPQDFDALNIINGASTAFLESYIRDDQAAAAFLASGDINSLTGGRATLEDRK